MLCFLVGNSKKFNKAGLAYELGIVIYHNKLVWINNIRTSGLKTFDRIGKLRKRGFKLTDTSNGRC
jgi:hypothetical protein